MQVGRKRQGFLMMVPQFRIRNSSPLSGLEGLGVQDTEDDSKEFLSRGHF